MTPVSPITVPDALFPTNNEFGIPMLRPDRQADFVDAPFKGWGSVRRRDRHKGTWHFYTDDYKFSALWKNPDQLVDTCAPSTVEVNFSLGEQTPWAVALYETYRKRWMARYWQDMGIRIFVDLNVPDEHFETNLLGVPVCWRAYATKATDYKLPLLRWQADRAAYHADSDILLVVYGGGKKVAQACEENNWVHVPEKEKS